MVSGSVGVRSEILCCFVVVYAAGEVPIWWLVGLFGLDRVDEW